MVDEIVAQDVAATAPVICRIERSHTIRSENGIGDLIELKTVIVPAVLDSCMGNVVDEIMGNTASPSAGEAAWVSQALRCSRSITKPPASMSVGGGTSDYSNPSSAVQKVVFLISNDLRKISAVFLHYILHRF
jgi:hypothetical protein